MEKTLHLKIILVRNFYYFYLEIDIEVDYILKLS